MGFADKWMSVFGLQGLHFSISNILVNKFWTYLFFQTPRLEGSLTQISGTGERREREESD